MRNIVLILIVSYILLGCASLNSGTIYPSAQLSSNNFKYIKTVSSEASVYYFLGIGGFNKYGLIATAKTKLYNEAGLTDNQAICNTTVDFQVSSFLFILVNEARVVLTADVIEFYNPMPNQTKELTIPTETKNVIPDTFEGFSVGDKVHFKIGVKTTQGTVIGFKPPKIEVEYYTSDNALISKELRYDSVFHVK